MAIKEGTWDCPSCGTRVRGPLKQCSQCGAPRPAGVRFNRPGANAPVVTDPDKISEAKAGPDWYCGACGSANSALRGNCKQCGAGKGASRSHSQSDSRLRPAESGARITYAPEERDGVSPIHRSYSSLPTETSLHIPGLAYFIGAAILVVIFAALIFRTTDIEMAVSGFSWHRSISIEEYRTVSEEDWSVPAGGRLVNSYTAISGYNQILDHYETKTRTVSEQVADGTETYVCGERDLGNGYYEDIECSRTTYRTENRTETYREPVYRQEPVYDTKYTYQIDKWVGAGSVPASGNDHNARWPEVSLGGNRREGGRSESYTIHLSANDGQDKKDYTTSNQEWMSYELRQSVVVTTNGFGAVTGIKPAP